MAGGVLSHKNGFLKSLRLIKAVEVMSMKRVATKVVLERKASNEKDQKHGSGKVVGQESLAGLR